MIINITVQVEASQVKIEVPEAKLIEEFASIIALDASNKICAIGEAEEEVRQAKEFKKWGIKNKTRFVDPFEFEKQGVEYAVAILRFYILKALRKMGRDFFKARLLDRCDYDLWLWNYEKFSPEVRDEFEYSLRTSSPVKIRNLFINGSPTTAPSVDFLNKKKVMDIQPNPLSKPLRVGYDKHFVSFGWASLLIAAGAAIYLVTSGQWSPVLIVLGLISLINGVATLSHRIEMDTETVAVTTWLRRREMKWEEVQWIERRLSRERDVTRLVFYGCNGRELRVTGPTNWNGTDRLQMGAFLEAQVEQYQIKIQDRPQDLVIF